MEEQKTDDLEKILGETISQEEYRKYELRSRQYEQIWGYFFDEVKQGSVFRISNDLYYFSIEEFGYAIARFRRGSLVLVGDSDVLGRIRKDIEKGIGSSLTEGKIIKAKNEEGNMGFPIDL